MASQGFWDDGEAAQATIQRLKTVNAVLKPVEAITSASEDIAALVELAEESADEEVETELRSELGRVTKLLDEAELEVEEMLVGWVFQDTWTGELEPRFTTRLSRADLVTRDDGWPLLRVTTRDRVVHDRAFVVADGDVAVRPPSAEEIIHAARRHRRHEQRAYGGRAMS